eukprot:m.15855 g.15855  ORF g.15855 m.15855 type:complete len:699 (+) comp8817_c0_seq1:58-2154(+)
MPPPKEKSPIKEFEDELAKVSAKKPPVSRSLVSSLTNLAVHKYAKYFKLVVYAVEKFIHKARSDFKVPGLYIIDSIMQASRKKYGAKDVYVERFGKNLTQTFQQLLRCKTEDQVRIAKVVKYWEKSKFYDEETLSTLIPSSSGPEAIMQIGGAAESLEAPLDGGHSAQLLLDDFDYGSDEDDESRIAEQQRMLAEGQRAARDAPLTTSVSGGATSILSELKKAPLVTEIPDEAPAVQAASAMASIQSLLSEAKAEAAVQQQHMGGPPPGQGGHAWQDPQRNGGFPRSDGHPGGPPSGVGQGNPPGARPHPDGAAPGTHGHAAAPPTPLRVLSKTLRLKGLSPNVGQAELQSVLNRIGPSAGLWLTDEATREWTCLMGRRQDAERAFRDLPAESVLRGIAIEWRPGEGQVKYLDASNGWKDWNPVTGVLMVPLRAVTPDNIAGFCAGSVIDRRTAPRDMLPDLDKYERRGDGYDGPAAQLPAGGGSPQRGFRDGRAQPPTQPPHAGPGPAQAGGDGGWHGRPSQQHGERAYPPRQAPHEDGHPGNRPGPRPPPTHSQGSYPPGPPSNGQFSPRREEPRREELRREEPPRAQFGGAPVAAQFAGPSHGSRGPVPQSGAAQFAGPNHGAGGPASQGGAGDRGRPPHGPPLGGHHGGGWEDERKRGPPGPPHGPDDGHDDGTKRRRVSRWSEDDASQQNRRI